MRSLKGSLNKKETYLESESVNWNIIMKDDLWNLTVTQILNNMWEGEAADHLHNEFMIVDGEIRWGRMLGNGAKVGKVYKR